MSTASIAALTATVVWLGWLIAVVVQHVVAGGLAVVVLGTTLAALLRH